MVSDYFDKKYQTFFHTVILKDDGPFGKVDADFERREYQARGTPHIHYFLWILKAPLFGRDSNEAIIEFIDKHITCELPDPETQPELYNLVVKYQTHRCGQSCQSVKWYKGLYIKYCRHGFPREARETITLNTVESTLKA